MVNHDQEQLFRERDRPGGRRRLPADGISRPKLAHQMGESANISPTIQAHSAGNTTVKLRYCEKRTRSGTVQILGLSFPIS